MTAAVTRIWIGATLWMVGCLLCQPLIGWIGTAYTAGGGLAAVVAFTVIALADRRR